MTGGSDAAPVAPARPPIRVLVVDDSAVAREVLSTVLRGAGFDVMTTASASVAQQRVAQQRPDVLLLDLQMPGMSGLEFLERQMRTAPLPIVVCSDIAQPGAAAAIRALELGAIEVIPKPSLGIRALLDGASQRLARIVRTAAAARTRRPAARTTPPMPMRAVGSPRAAATVTAPWYGRVILVGASTGGTEALREVLSGMPADAPPIVVVQHMPAEYTTAFARRLNEFTAVTVREAMHDDPLVPGTALIAPGGKQIDLVKGVGGVRVRISDDPPVSGHRPSVDSLFNSAAGILGDRVVAALLTGMGADGAEGLLALRRRGADTIAQNEASCVVFGMPKEAIALGAAAQVVPLETMAIALQQAAASRGPGRHPPGTARATPPGT